MRKIFFIITLFILIFSTAIVNGDDGVKFKIIINSANPDSTLSQEEIAKLFLKKIKRWEGTEDKVLPVDLVEDSKIRSNFSDKILEKKISSVKAYWQKQIFSGRGVPPPEKKSEQDVLEYVHENQSAIGYVSSKAKLGKYDIKVLQVEYPQATGGEK